MKLTNCREKLSQLINGAQHIKQTIQSVAWSYKQPEVELKAWSADFIKEKGEGQIFLHGTPGVGKTCTAGISFSELVDVESFTELII